MKHSRGTNNVCVQNFSFIFGFSCFVNVHSQRSLSKIMAPLCDQTDQIASELKEQCPGVLTQTFY